MKCDTIDAVLSVIWVWDSRYVFLHVCICSCQSEWIDWIVRRRSRGDKLDLSQISLNACFCLSDEISIYWPSASPTVHSSPSCFQLYKRVCHWPSHTLPLSYLSGFSICQSVWLIYSLSKNGLPAVLYVSAVTHLHRAMICISSRRCQDCIMFKPSI